jgi:short-subunit dehydrogenase
MSKILVIGANGGIGTALVKELLSRNNNVTAWTSKDLDLNYPELIFTKNFNHYDILINCAAHSQGTYLGFLNNKWQNQISQITVNYTSNLMLFKHYAQSRSAGKYVWISTDLLQGARPFHSVYVSTKAASKIAFDLIKQDVTNINILEVKVGLTRSNFRYRNFEGTRSIEEINAIYDQEQALSPECVAANIVAAIDKNEKEIYIT